ncbi:hypothetical protein PL654_13775 [Phocaeicola vulgatus]|nr:hypothetical protein [Phocaeicola vulgatus]
MDLNNIVGFKAVDKNGNERQVTVDEMTELVSARIVSAASEISTFAAAAAAGTDEFEDQLPQSDTFSWLRTLDGSKNPTLTSSSAAAKVLGELIPLATNEVNGLMSKNNYIKIAQSITSTKLIKIESWDGYSTLVFIRTSGSTGLYSIDGNWADSAKFTRLSGPLGKDHFNAYRERNGNIYVKTTTQSEPLTVTSVGSNR